MDRYEFGIILKKHRHTLSWTLQDLCDELNARVRAYSPSYISSIENGIKMPSPQFVVRCAKVLNINTEELWDIARQSIIQDFKERLDKNWAKKIGNKSIR